MEMTETWLDSDFGDHERLMDGFNIFRKDRNSQRDGGVLLAVRDHLPCSRRSDLEIEAEMLALKIVFDSQDSTDPLTLMLTYFLFQLGQFLDKFSRTGLSNLIDTGDFKYPHIDWCTGCLLRSDPSTEEFCNLLDDFFSNSENQA